MKLSFEHKFNRAEKRWESMAFQLSGWSSIFFMNATLDTLFADALTLSDKIRLQLVERHNPTIESMSSLEAKQVQEVQKRRDEVRSGRVKTVPGEQVFQEIEKSLAARRSA